MTASRHRRAKLTFVEPCYWIAGRIAEGDTILDFGLGNDADFSQAMIARFGVTSLGFDPTARHAAGLASVAKATSDRLRPHQLALGATRGHLTFYESQDNISGSVLADHPNVRKDRVVSYDVEVITLADAIARCSPAVPRLAKMDIEGAEYDVLEGADDTTLRSIDQWVIEFHHGVIPGVTYARTDACVKRFKRLGFAGHTLDGVNFLFYAAGA